jgi:hypothetical protein
MNVGENIMDNEILKDNYEAKMVYKSFLASLKKIENVLSTIKSRQEVVNNYCHSDVKEDSLLILARINNIVKDHYRFQIRDTLFSSVKEDLIELFNCVKSYVDEDRKTILKSTFRELQSHSNSLERVNQKFSRERKIDTSLNRLENHVFGRKKFMEEIIERMSRNDDSSNGSNGSNRYHDEEVERYQIEFQRKAEKKESKAKRKLIQKFYKQNLDRKDKGLNQLDMMITKVGEIILTGWEADELPIYKSHLKSFGCSHLIKYLEPEIVKSNVISIDYDKAESDDVKSMLESKLSNSKGQNKDLLARKMSQL